MSRLENHSKRGRGKSSACGSLEGAKGGQPAINRCFVGSTLHRLVLAVLCVSLFAPVRQVCAQAPKLDTSAVGPADTANEDVVTLMGKVTSEDVSHAGMTILNIGRSWRFQAIVLRSAASSFPDLKQWEGKRVLVTGKVQHYEHRAAIVIRSPWQLKLASPGAAPQ